MTKLIKNKKGASSILVILLLVVLVVFGVAALTTALSNVRLGQKVVDWNEKYYKAEAKASEMYAQIDGEIDKIRKTSISLSSQDAIEKAFIESTGELDFDVETSIGDDTIDFIYEVWQDDVGISVMLILETKEDFDLTVAQWKALQK